MLEKRLLTIQRPPLWFFPYTAAPVFPYRLCAALQGIRSIGSVMYVPSMKKCQRPLMINGGRLIYKLTIKIERKVSRVSDIY